MPNRRFSWQFRVQLCSDIRSGVITRSEAQRKHRLSGQVMTLWLGQFDRGELSQEVAEPTLEDERELTIAALQRKVDQQGIAVAPHRHSTRETPTPMPALWKL